MSDKSSKKKCCEVVSLLESIKKLEEQVNQLSDENSSLWDMLDEIRDSDVKNFEDALQEAHREIEIDRLLRGPAMGEA